jgi:DNA-binding NarL/FixJ family response regulator
MCEPVVLIIDDDPVAREMAKLAVQLVAQARAETITPLVAENGEVGLRLLRTQASSQRVRAVVLDLNFPGDVDGRFLAPLIRTEFPDLPIIPFTADQQASNPQHYQTFGLPEPVIKPCRPEVLAARLEQVLAAPETPPLALMQDFFAEQGRQMVQLIQRIRVSARPLQVGVLAATHLEQLGLTYALSEVKQQLPLDIVVAESQADPVISYSQARRLDVLVATPARLDAAEQVAAAQEVPLLIYATIDEARHLIDQPTPSLIVGPTTANELLTAFLTMLHGHVYRHPQMVGMLSLTERQVDLLRLLIAGTPAEELAGNLGLSESRVRHLFTELYKQLHIPPSRPALTTWAHAAPLHLLPPSRST